MRAIHGTGTYHGEQLFIDAESQEHTIELQVGESKLSREVTVTKQGVRPQEVTFRRTGLEMAPAAATPPQTAPAAAGQAVLTRSAPEMTPADQQADQHLLSLLPGADALDKQLQASRDENVTAQYEAGLKALRYGYARGNRSYLSIAATRFRDVVRLAPDLALGYFSLGLAQFYLDDFSNAQAAFAECVKLDASLKDRVPLLWYENFQVAGRGRRRPQFLAHGSARQRSALRQQQGQWPDHLAALDRSGAVRDRQPHRYPLPLRQRRRHQHRLPLTLRRRGGADCGGGPLEHLVLSDRRPVPGDGTAPDQSR